MIAKSPLLAACAVRRGLLARVSLVRLYAKSGKQLPDQLSSAGYPGFYEDGLQMILNRISGDVQCACELLRGSAADNLVEYLLLSYRQSIRFGYERQHVSRFCGTEQYS